MSDEPLPDEQEPAPAVKPLPAPIQERPRASTKVLERLDELSAQITYVSDQVQLYGIEMTGGLDRGKRAVDRIIWLVAIGTLCLLTIEGIGFLLLFARLWAFVVPW